MVPTAYISHILLYLWATFDPHKYRKIRNKHTNTNKHSTHRELIRTQAENQGEEKTKKEGEK